MQLKSVKNAADLPFKGIELVKVDGSISEVIIGGKLRIRAGQYGGMQVLTDTPGERADRYRVEAKLDGFPTATEYHDSEYDAKRSAEVFTEKGAAVTQAKVPVLIDDAGGIIEAPANEPVPAFDEIPF